MARAHSLERSRCSTVDARLTDKWRKTLSWSCTKDHLSKESIVKEQHSNESIKLLFFFFSFQLKNLFRNALSTLMEEMFDSTCCLFVGTNEKWSSCWGWEHRREVKRRFTRPREQPWKPSLHLTDNRRENSTTSHSHRWTDNGLNRRFSISLICKVAQWKRCSNGKICLFQRDENKFKAKD